MTWVLPWKRRRNNLSVVTLKSGAVYYALRTGWRKVRSSFTGKQLRAARRRAVSK